MDLADRTRNLNLMWPLLALLACSLPQAARSAQLVDVLQPFVDRHELAGAVTLVASKDRVLSLEAVGYADVAARKPMQTDAVFWIASMSKPIAVTALMMLVDEGKVRLDDPVETYLPQFKPLIIASTADGAQVRLQKPRHVITVRYLLSHTSGIPFSSSVEVPTLDVLPLSVRVSSYAMQRLMFEPGKDYSYSNAGINTAARIVEVVSGMPYEEYLQQRLFGPLGMADTTFWPSEDQLARLAGSYKANATSTGLLAIHITQLSYPLSDHTRRFAVPAGGLFSTASDLAKFCQIFLNGGTLAGKRYLSEAAIREMSRNQLPDDVASVRFGPVEPAGYGLGWFVESMGAFGHTGAYSTNMRIDPKHELITVWLVQHANFPGDGGKSRDAFEEAAQKQFASAADGPPKK
jgi:CubicO group peptidase (beta-lactamase class C family)